MRIASLVLATLLAMVLTFAASAETEAVPDPVGETETVEAGEADLVEVAEAAEVSDVAEEALKDEAEVEVVAAWDALAKSAAPESPAEIDEAQVAGEVGVELATADSEPAEATDAVAWDDFDDPEFNPGDPTSELADSYVAPGLPEGDAALPIEIEGSTLVVGGVTLGPVGVDAEGRVGRIHTVSPGDTLWDVSNAYLGTAWVWPSVWKDNNEIQNPHLIEPGDRLWISSTEIRPISDAEADEYLADAASLQDAEEVVEVAAELPEVFDEFPAADDEFAMPEVDEFEIAALDQLPVGMPDAGNPGRGTGRTVRVSMRENMGFVSDVQLQASTVILGSPSDRQHLSLMDTIYLGLGEGEVEVGDEFTFFRNVTDVRSPSSNALIGYHVDVLGWAEVIEVTGETCVAVIRVSLEGTQRGDRVMPRYQTPTDVDVLFAEDGIEGEIAFMPANRTLMSTTDYVFLDVGAVQGVEIGTDLEVYDPGYRVKDSSRDQVVTTPDRIVADLVVVTVQEESAVAFVAHARRELAIGDVVRGATREYGSAF